MAKRKKTSNTESQVEEASAALSRKRNEWLRRPDVTAVDVGYRYKGRMITDEIALRVHVERKLPRAALAKHELITDSEAPETIDGFPVDVVEGKYGPAMATAPAQIEAIENVDRKGRINPLAGGISCGNPRITAGTLGAIVWDRTNGKPSILSNWHVLCGSQNCEAGEAIRQPGKLDGGTEQDKVAGLTRFRLDRDSDAAIANLSGQREFTRDVVGLDPISGVTEPQLGMKVVKSGRTTGITEGKIDGVNMSLSINYGGGTVQTFQNQIRIVPLPPWPNTDYEVSEGGDSGSVWIEQSSNRAVGLHFAGETNTSPTAEHAIANRMTEVVRILNISFTPLTSPAPPPTPPISWSAKGPVRAVALALPCQSLVVSPLAPVYSGRSGQRAE